MLIQFSHPQSAILAMDGLNGETVYVGQDPVIGLATSIQYSNLQELSVKQQGPDSRYTPVPVCVCERDAWLALLCSRASCLGASPGITRPTMPQRTPACMACMVRRVRCILLLPPPLLLPLLQVVRVHLRTAPRTRTVLRQARRLRLTRLRHRHPPHHHPPHPLAPLHHPPPTRRMRECN